MEVRVLFRENPTSGYPLEDLGSRIQVGRESGESLKKIRVGEITGAIERNNLLILEPYLISHLITKQTVCQIVSDSESITAPFERVQIGTSYTLVDQERAKVEHVSTAERSGP